MCFIVPSLSDQVLVKNDAIAINCSLFIAIAEKNKEVKYMDRKFERMIKETRRYQAPQCDVLELSVEDICRTSNAVTMGANGTFEDYKEEGWF